MGVSGASSFFVPRGHSRRSVEDEGAAGLGLPAVLAVPDPDSLALDAELPAEIAEVLGVLAGVGLLDLLTQRSTVAGAVLADNARLLSALRLKVKRSRRLSATKKAVSEQQGAE